MVAGARGNFWLLKFPDALKMPFPMISCMCWLSTLNVAESEIGFNLFDQIDISQGRVLLTL